MESTKAESVAVNRIRVLVVDDSVVIRKIVADALEQDAAVEVVGRASSGKRALEKIAEVNPDVVTLDADMPEVDCLAAVREIHAAYPRVKVILCTTAGRSADEAAELFGVIGVRAHAA